MMKNRGLRSSSFALLCRGKSVYGGRQIFAKKGFTLIEMLTVLVIIGLLLSMLFPALNKARQRARVVKARGEVRELTKACKAYWYTYKKWGALSSGDMTASNVKILQGDNTDKIMFMTFPPGAEDDGFEDPWGNIYKITLTDPNANAQSTVWSYSTKVYLNNRHRQ